MLLDAKHFSKDFRLHFEVDGELNIKEHINPRNKQVTQFTFYGHTVKRRESFFAELHQVFNDIKDARGENIDVKV